MTDIYPPGVQHEALVRLAESVCSAATALRRDECGDPRFNGSRGHIYAVIGTLGEPGKEGFLLYCRCESGQAWTWAKKKMAFAKVTQDGDDEGILFLDRFPTKSEAEIIRAYLGIAKRPQFTAETLARKREVFPMVRRELAEKCPAADVSGSLPNLSPKVGILAIPVTDEATSVLAQRAVARRT